MKKSSSFLSGFFTVFITASIFFIFAFASFADDSNNQMNLSKGTAKTLYGTFKGKYGSPSGIKQNAIAPLMSSESKMSTLNGEKQFTAQIECPSSTAFLQIFLEPTETNDFYAVISQDPQLSGHFTYSVRTPLVSGVCTSGFISCDAGTWRNCHFYRWALNPELQVTWVEEINATPLGTCFCINNHCGGNVFQQFSQIANTFGAGLAGFIADKTHFAISRVSAIYPMLTYYGQDSSKCTVIHGKRYSGYNSQNPTQYYKNAPAMNNAVSVAVQSQSNDTNSPYYVVENNEYLKNTPVNEKHCEVRRTVKISEQKWITDGGSVIDTSCQSIEKVGYNLYKCTLFGETKCSITEKYQVDGSFYVYLHSPDDFDGYVKIGEDTVFSLNEGATGGVDPYTYENTLSTSGTQWVTIHVQNCGACYSSGNNGPATARFAIFLRRSEKVSEIKNDSCLNLNTDNCRLKNEQMCDVNGNNCVYTIRNYHETGVVLIKNCRSVQDAETGLDWLVCVDGDSMTYEINPDSGLTPSQGVLEMGKDIWWTVKKTYTCKSPNINMPTLSREKNIVENENYNSSRAILFYPDNTTEYYGLGGYSGIFYIQTKSQPSESCSYTCIVRTHPVRTSVIMSGSETTNAPPKTPPDKTNKDKYLVCEKDNNGTWYCPATGEEEVIQPCVCLDKGASSIAVMSALISAAKDLTCSKE